MEFRIHAQVGDSLDKPGKVQKPLDPADQTPPAPALSTGDALRIPKVAKGYRVELAVCEPQVQQPVAISFGPDGRICLAEMIGYMPNVEGNGEDLPTSFSRIAIRMNSSKTPQSFWMS